MYEGDELVEELRVLCHVHSISFSEGWFVGNVCYGNEEGDDKTCSRYLVVRLHEEPEISCKVGEER